MSMSQFDTFMGIMRGVFIRGMMWGGLTVIFALVVLKLIFDLPIGGTHPCQ